MRNAVSTLILFAALAFPAAASAADYVIDTKGAHASINFRIQHLGYSWLTGRFNDFRGSFSFDKDKVSASKITVEIDTKSVDSNHAERDKHLRSSDFLDVDKYPTARFESTAVEVTGDRTATVRGKLTLHGVTREIAIKAEYIGGGEDPWGGYRQGFAGTTRFALEDFGITKNLGPASREVEMTLHIEGIRQ